MDDHTPWRKGWQRLVVGLGILPLTALAAEPVRLEPIEVRSPRLEREWLATPAAVGVVEEEALQQGRQNLQLDESLNRVPGVFFQNRYNFAQNLRLSIRGFGARAPFGVRGIYLLIDGIPETLPDGQSQVDAIDLESAQNVEVIRGPSSVLYGNAAGGVVAVTTREPPAKSYGELRGSIGAYDFRRYGIQGGGEVGRWGGHVSAWDMRLDGYRAQSRVEKRLFNGKARYRIDDERSLTAVATLLDAPLGEDPGGLTLEEVRADRRQANPLSLTLDAGQEVEQQRLGLVYRDDDALGGTLRLRGFYTARDFQQQLPFYYPGAENLLSYRRDFFGASVDYTASTEVAAHPLHYTVGVEAREQRDDRQRYQVDTARVVTGQTQDELQTATAFGAFAQADLDLTERLILTLGGRYDQVRLRIDDRFAVAGDQSAERSYDELSALLGILYRLTPSHSLYFNTGTAFETPTFTEIKELGGGGGFVRDLQPQEAVSVETGLKGFLGDRAQYDVVVFAVRTDDEIVQVEGEGGANTFRNASSTRRYGVEAAFEYFLNADFAFTAAYTFADFRFDAFDDGTAIDYDDNRLPGLPRHTVFAELAWRPADGRYAVLDALGVGRVYADNANTEEVAGYGVVNARIGNTWAVGDSELEAFLAANNLTDRDYYSNVRVNANGGRYYEPAPERHWYAGLRLRFQ